MFPDAAGLSPSAAQAPHSAQCSALDAKSAGVQIVCQLVIFSPIPGSYRRGRDFPAIPVLARSTADDLQKQVEFLKAENEMLRKRVPRQRVFLNHDERNQLVKLGRELGPAIRQLITIVDYSTFRRWIRKAEGPQRKAGRGRPRLAAIFRELVVQIANETGWGYSRILGELRKLNLGKISRQSVKNILVEQGIDPGPRRGKGSWSEFLKIHAETLWQVDFFSKLVVTPTGLRQAFAMAFIHVGTRRVLVTPATFKPDADWMKSQAHAFLDFAGQQQLKCGTLMRDWDGKYSKDFLAVFTDRGIVDKPVGPRAPNLNAFVERWIQSVKHEALNHLIVFGLAHFDHIVREFVDYYHERRPHQRIGNRLVVAISDHEAPPITSVNQVRCESRLGGLLKSYCRAA